MNRPSHIAFASLVFVSWTVTATAATASEPVEVEAVVLRLLEEAEVPAQESGVITQIAAREGQRVARGELLAQIDDQVAQLAAAAAELQFNVAAAKATNDVRLRFAQKALEVSEAELKRSTESVERFAKSVSQSQLDVERLTVEKNRLELEQASHEHHVAQLEMKVKDHERTAARAAVTRRRIAAPFDGIVVQVLVRQGEWVESGRQALRVVSVDRLKAEGFLPAHLAKGNLSDAAVKLETVSKPSGTVPILRRLPEQNQTVPLSETVLKPLLTTSGESDKAESFTGKIVFVSPEVDPITNQVRIWAEIDNREGRLRPGQPVKMVIAK
jgi:macrolide-specific efflux system membrane fusion protein